MAAKKKEIRRVTPAAPMRRRQEIVALYVPQKTKQTEMIAGIRRRGAPRRCVRKLREDARVICMILVIAEQRDGALNRASWEAVAAAQQLAAGAAGRRGHRRRRRGARGGRDCGGRRRRGHHDRPSPALAGYTADGWVAAHRGGHRRREAVVRACCRTRIRRATSRRRWPPRSTARSSPTAPGSRPARRGPLFTRPMFQGKLAADVRPLGDAPWLVTMQIGAFRADAAQARRIGGARARRSTSRSTPPRFARRPRRRSARRGRPSTSRRPSASSPSAAASRGPSTCRSRRRWPTRSAPRSPRRGRSATRAGCRWSARSAAPARPSRRSCTSRSASPAPSSTSSA